MPKRKFRPIQQTRVHLNWRDRAKLELTKKGIFKGGKLTKIGKKELDHANLFIRQDGITTLMKLREKEQSPFLATTKLGTLYYWMTKVPEEEKKKFREKYPDPNKELKERGL